ncbi:MAG TPA: enoyl-CoA hydratase/isomerase family protein [Pyrinomonadaceae bacterium]|jgi:enoyl-CoA hydratase|nr:enoyl-CoA hydratase/isomerase family protein [Pyrinomonadaceae bacterium]
MTGDAHEVRESALVVETRGHIAIIRFNRPAERNSLSVSTLQELDATFSALTLLDDISTIIFTGAGDVFASGANIRELHMLTLATAKTFAERGQHLFQKIAGAPQLTIAAINGYCMGGGLDLALACAVRIASPGAVFAHPGARLGIITGWGGTQRLPRLIGAARALEMFLTARHVTSAEAHTIGLVGQVSDDVINRALEVARGCAGLKVADRLC